MLVPDYLETSGQQSPYDHYWMTPAGLVLSAEGARITGLIEELLSFFCLKISEDMSFSQFTWNDLKNKGIAKDDQEFYLFDTTIRTMRFQDGGSSTPGPPPSFQYQVPPDIDKLRRFRDFDDFLELRQRQKNESQRSFVELTQAIRREAEVPYINIHHHGNINVGTQVTSTITNSTIGAVAIGARSQAQGGTYVSTPTQDQHRASIKRAPKALIDDEDHLDPIVYEALELFLRAARDVRVEGRVLAEVQAELMQALDEIWEAKRVGPQALPAGLKVVEVLAKCAVTAEVAKKLGA